MKKFVILAALAASSVTGPLRADPAARVAAFGKATGNGGDLLAITFNAAPGSMTNALRELSAAGWTDDAVIASGDANVILWAVRADGAAMSEGFAGKLASYVRANGLLGEGPKLAAQTMGAVPVGLRAQFKEAYLEYAHSLYPRSPVRAAILVDNAMRSENGSALLPAKYSPASLKTLGLTATVEELVALRLAPEVRPSDEAALILDKATAAAKKQLRREGGSFVTKDGVNPLADRITPVVEALNAPLMAGIEAALRGCGIGIADQSAARAALASVADGWRAAVLDGEVAPGAEAPYLNALKVRMGIEDYNRFVDEYNDGAPQ